MNPVAIQAGRLRANASTRGFSLILLLSRWLHAVRSAASYLKKID